MTEIRRIVLPEEAVREYGDVIMLTDFLVIRAKTTNLGKGIKIFVHRRDEDYNEILCNGYVAGRNTLEYKKND